MKNKLKALLEIIKGKMTAIASDETVDRHGDSLKIADWDLKNFKTNPVIPFAHDYWQPPVGIAKNIKIKDGKLTFEPVFHEITQLAREVKKMYEDGIMKAFSVGFIPHDMGEKGVRLELLEISAVPVPSNPSALVLEKSMKKKITESERKEYDTWYKECNEVEKREGKVLSKKTKGLLNKAIEALSELVGLEEDDKKDSSQLKLKSKYFKKGRSQEAKALEKLNNQVGFIVRQLKNK